MGWAVVIHGGAGLIRKASLSAEREAACTAALEHTLQVAQELLAGGATALDAAEAAVVSLEEEPHFNAGRGAVLAEDGTVEHDAAIMCGRTRQAGAVTAMRTTRNPVCAARMVLEHTPHVLLVGGDGLAAEHGLEQVDNAWFVTPERAEQLERARASGRFHLDHGGGAKDVYGTVGAVCCDQHGHVAAATSTGGMVNKRTGRVGDTPVIGAGTYAHDRTAAVSGTGHGEMFLRAMVAGRVAAWMDIGGLSLAEAAERVIHTELPEIGGQGGLIAVDSAGHVALPFNTGGMFRGSWSEGGEPSVAIW